MASATGKFEFSLLFCVCAAIVLLMPRALRSDDLKLKDGTTISGTIVGFEENSFRVKTSYGYAVVQKDQVVSITVSASDKTSSATNSATPEVNTAADEKPKTSRESAPVPAPPPAVAEKTQLPASFAAPIIPPKKKPAPAAEESLMAAPAMSLAPVAVPALAVPAAPRAPVTAPAPVAVAVLKAPALKPIREEVNGNTYTNDTYRFQMYKPPDWEVIAGAPALLPGAIAAMGTNDQTTYLLIGEESAVNSVAAGMEATENRLRDVMDNFRPLAMKQITVAASAATEVSFRGSVDDQEWSGVIVLVPRGARLYTIFGMTRADSDLVQIQENVIARAISSLQFTGP